MRVARWTGGMEATMATSALNSTEIRPATSEYDGAFEHRHAQPTGESVADCGADEAANQAVERRFDVELGADGTRASTEGLAQANLVASLRDDRADCGADATSVSTSTTSETIQNSVCSMVMMRVSEAVILVTCCALTCMEVMSLMLDTRPARSLRRPNTR